RRRCFIREAGLAQGTVLVKPVSARAVSCHWPGFSQNRSGHHSMNTGPAEMPRRVRFRFQVGRSGSISFMGTAANGAQTGTRRPHNRASAKSPIAAIPGRTFLLQTPPVLVTYKRALQITDAA